jgi:hypothetical protein
MGEKCAQFYGLDEGCPNTPVGLVTWSDSEATVTEWLCRGHITCIGSDPAFAVLRVEDTEGKLVWEPHHA